ncbi:IucA/IucC family C-terminal-domain containing protein [Evansella halocellulosilytica]|uniref:IucA/IucC family C-terminal-domain containing protein n=1 Tax=Evansella halocellulosilytica TaxID=2011013 RepID=UPI0015CB2A0E|nr:IucA/IucC family C-terminal-domain containing protein [Evansella halocellulosilytica]
MNESLLANEQGDTITALELTDEKKCKDYLNKVTEKIQSPSLMVTASQFSKQYARFITTPAFSTMTLQEKGFDVSLENSVLKTDWSGANWNKEIDFMKERTWDIPKRKIGREDIVNKVFANHLSQVWRTIANVANVPKLILWENTAVRIFSLYEKKLQENASSSDKKRIEEDLDYLVHEAPGSLFGEKRNPLKQFFQPKRGDKDGDVVRERQTCCFYYEICNGEKFCSVCPKQPKK